MLGFSPYDGYDIWGNNVIIGGNERIFANFHHYHYNPKDQSDRDLVFIPVKPPREFRKNENEYFTHNMIAGREGNLKRTDISKKTRDKLMRELRIIEDRIEHNISIIEEAVLTTNSELLYKLRGWSKKSIENIIRRLHHFNFTWAKGIEKYIPTANGYDYERISADETNKIIQEIVKSRKKRR